MHCRGFGSFREGGFFFARAKTAHRLRRFRRRLIRLCGRGDRGGIPRKKWCPGWDSNPHTFRYRFLRPTRLPFRHPGAVLQYSGTRRFRRGQKARGGDFARFSRFQESLASGPGSRAVRGASGSASRLSHRGRASSRDGADLANEPRAIAQRIRRTNPGRSRRGSGERTPGCRIAGGRQHFFKSRAAGFAFVLRRAIMAATFPLKR